MAKAKLAHHIDAKQIRECLESQNDFAFELRCRQALAGLPAKVDHSGTYADPVTNKPRQFDLRVRLEVGDLRACLAVECKNLTRAFPMVASRVRRSKEEAFHDVLVASEKYGDAGCGLSIAIPRTSGSKRIEVSSPDTPYEAGEWVGKSVTRIGVQAHGEFVISDSEIFDRWSQAVSSAYGLISAADSELWDADNDLAFWIVPIVVVPQGTLWAADYDFSGRLMVDPNPVDAVEMYIDHAPSTQGQTFDYRLSHLHFVTENGLVALVSRFINNASFRERIFPADLLRME